MLFNSLQYLLFLPVVFSLYWFVFKKLKAQNIFIVIASYFFYGMWDWRFLFLIFLTSVTSYYSGIYIGQNTDNRKKQHLAIAANFILNIGILIYFKYFNFFADNLKILFEQFGFQLDWFTLEVLLPVGISFYTFQAVSYSIDVYRKKIKPTTDLIAFLSFVAFFPQLVAGPIERSTNLLPQFLKGRKFNYDKAVDGSRRILWGFFKKLVIADNCAYLANSIFNDPSMSNGSMLILGAIFFTFQIYGDFSGYSDIAIGSAHLFGIELKQNFHYPYLSRNPGEFWRRWHISLNKWFVEYVYIPLGGSRSSKWKTARNIMIVFLLSGLWHGAAWTFVLWGAYHGILLASSRFIGLDKTTTPTIAENSILPSIKEFLGLVITFVLVVFGWIIFRCNTVSEAFIYISQMLTNGPLERPITNTLIANSTLVYTIGFIILLQIIEYMQRHKAYALDIANIKSRVIRWCIYLIVTMTIIIFAGTREQFIYFQF